MSLKWIHLNAYSFGRGEGGIEGGRVIQHQFSPPPSPLARFPDFPLCVINKYILAKCDMRPISIGKKGDMEKGIGRGRGWRGEGGLFGAQMRSRGPGDLYSGQEDGMYMKRNTQITLSDYVKRITIMGMEKKRDN